MTTSKEKTGNPGMRQTRKGKQWHFGMKAHIGAEKRDDIAKAGP